jgi:hypothetical protein
MTSEIWVGGGTENQKIAAGSAVRQSVGLWGHGHVEAFVRIRGGVLAVESATDFSAPDSATLQRLKAVVDGTEV